MKQIDEVKEYFENETKGFVVDKIELIEHKESYLFSTNCYQVFTKQNVYFYVFCSDNLPTNLILKRMVKRWMSVIISILGLCLS